MNTNRIFFQKKDLTIFEADRKLNSGGFLCQSKISI